MKLLTSFTALVLSAVLSLTASGVQALPAATPAPETQTVPAQEEAAEEASAEEAETDPEPEEHPIADGAREIIENYLSEHRLGQKQIAVGWRDIRSGEEYYFNPDTNFYGASLYKLALNMYFAEQVSAGEMDWDSLVSGAKLDVLMTGSLEESNNNYSYALTRYFGSYRKFRIRTSYLYGMTPEETMADRRYLRDSWITPRRMITCLQTLYDEPDRFPRVTMHLFRAQPGRYFRWFEDRWPIAQKYGYLRISLMEISTAGIVYVPERPFLLVVLTHGAPRAEEAIGQLCALLGDYALTLIEPKPSLSR